MMKLQGIKPAAATLALLIPMALVALPTATSAGKLVAGAGFLEAVDLADSTVTVKGRKIKVSGSSTFYDEGGRRISFDDLSRLEGEEVGYTAYPLGRQLLLKSLRLGEEDDG